MSVPAPLQLSPASRVAVETIGAEGARVGVIDACLADPDAAIELAASLPFAPIGPYYPGLRASLGADAACAFGQTLRAAIADALDLSPAGFKGECFFSMVTTPPDRLMPIQRLPHFDGLEDTRVAVLIFLSRAEFGGTSFYRHRITGFETINAARYKIYGEALKADVERHGLPPAAYIGDGAPIFEEIATYAPAFNRLLVYRGNALHCSRIPNAALLSADPRAGRLTLNLFLEPA